MREFEHPLTGRYASRAMRELFSPATKFSTWRRLWLELMRAERDLGIDIPSEALEQLAAHIEITPAELARADELETETRHDVMAHVRALAETAPAAGPWLHLGATSAYVGDNTDLIVLRRATTMVLDQGSQVVTALAGFARAHRDLPCLGHTHFQPAQPTTVGKRACLWLADLLLDLERLVFERDRLRLRGAKGTTGTQASFLQLLGSDAKVRELDRRIATAFDFPGSYPITGQTSPRKPEFYLLAGLSGIAQSAYKFACDVRLLSRLKELDEPASSTQVGSSAMPYKRNPMRCERVTGLARLVLSLATSPGMTASEQWFERTLDDSSNRRVVIPEAFLAVDGILQILLNVFDGLVVYPRVIEAHVAAELPFMASENILMAAVKAGGNRQELHEKIRLHAQAASAEVKRFGRPNDLIARLQTDIDFATIDFAKILDPAAYVGRAPRQVDEFLKTIVAPVRKRYQKELGRKVELRV
jgi:adenylosuccinate lyase